MFNFLEDYRHFNTFSAYPPAADRRAWLNISENFRVQLINVGEQYLGYHFPAIMATTYMAFLRTGNRVAFEDINFAKRYALNALIMAECAEYEGRFLDDIINGIFSICEESAWQLPPHNSYPELPNQLLPDVTRPVIDLFACETGALLATAGYLLKDALNNVHPFIYKRILHEITTRVLKPYIETEVWWMGLNDRKTCNWTIWCTQNVLITAFLSEQSEDIREKVFTKACRSASAFVNDYGEDGCCDEGAGYYRHAGLCLFNTMELLDNITNGHVHQLYSDSKIRNIALYILNVHADDIYYINFADCSPVAGRAGAREFLFGKRIESKAMQSFAAKEWRAAADTGRLLLKEINLYYHVQNAFVADEIDSFTESATTHNDIYYSSVGLFIARDDTFVLAVKAGHNADSHNHNDTGSLTLYKNGKPFLIDAGVGTYTGQTFSADRYKLWFMQSAYHNLPTLNKIMQKDGIKYAASDVSVSFADKCSEISMDIAGAYPHEAGINKYHRTVTLNKGNNLTISDSWSFNDDCAENEVVLSLMTYERPAINNNVISIGELGKITVVKPSAANSIIDITAEEIPINDARLQEAWKHSLYRILVKVCHCSPSENILIRLS